MGNTDAIKLSYDDWHTFLLTDAQMQGVMGAELIAIWLHLDDELRALPDFTSYQFRHWYTSGELAKKQDPFRGAVESDKVFIQYCIFSENKRRIEAHLAGRRKRE